MISCPNCRGDTASRMLPAHGTPRPLTVEACAPCNLFWFDDGGSVRLSPPAVIELFKYIGTVAGAPRTALAATFACPRCSRPLAYTHDLQRTTRFTFWRCPRDGGQLITFQQFLREKNFIRTPSPAELARLRDTVRQVSCSQCGAPVDLAADSACPHCGTPVALVDPDGIAHALSALATEQAAAAPPGPEKMRAILAAAQADAMLAGERARREQELEQRHDLVAIGVAAIGAWLADKLDAS